MRTHVMALLAASLVSTGACGPGIASEDEPDASTQTTDASDTTDAPATTSAGSSTTQPESTTTDGGLDTHGGYEDDGSGTGCTFTCPPPPPPPPEGGMCNCPSDEKCMPMSIDGTEEWNAIRCSPIAENPGQPGERCTVEGHQWSGIDDCDDGAMCWVTNPEANEGVCIAFCSWFGDGPCDEGYECQAQPGELMLPLCAPSCDPTVADCPDGMGCFPGGASFTCQPASKMRAPVGSPCTDPLACEVDALCAYGVDCGQDPGQGCCASTCDTTQPDPCPLPATCTPWFGDAGPAQWAHVGYCAG